ncbi:DNA polymerase III subunit delta' [Nitrosomonas sp. Nm33]|uniref:DNA polymerase III subunit delta' n=1 Tax=Nitrosomonas sp. Nm33 TaxID=133724 RepID=UPI0008968AEF|nr:DNA polymerase III subunit delta' [Nitrosomonas sp. Nm33]SDZ07625.1 DNA polymerase-3 subunit delta' [Nitrosomonas sp. Nm33]
MAEFYPWQYTVWQQIRGTVVLKTHALLLKGRKGIGKLDFARSLAKSLLCKQITAERVACGMCASCKWFEQGAHPNFYLITPEALIESSGGAGSESSTTDKQDADSGKSGKKPSQHITIEQVRALNDFVYFSGHQDGLKVILIHPAEAMNGAAANALLKKLEEPPSNVLFILVAHHSQDLLPTIRSRCQQITLPIPDAATARNWLVQQGVEHADICLALAGASPLQAVAFNHDDYFSQHADFIRQISLPASFDPISLTNRLHKLDLPEIVSWLQKWCYDLMSFYTTGKIRYHVQQETTIRKLVATADPKLLAIFWRNLITSQQLSRHPLNAKLFLEEMLLSYIRVMVPERYAD